MLTKIKLTKKQKQDLFEIKKKNISEIIRDRAHVILLRNKGKTIEDIAEALFRSKDFVNQAINRFKKKELDNLNLTSHNCKLSFKQKKEIIEMIKTKNPKDLKEFKFKQQFWTTDILRLVIKKEYKVEYKTEKSYYDLFKAAGFSFHKPKTKDFRQDPKKIEEFKGALKKSSTTTRLRFSW